MRQLQRFGQRTDIARSKENKEVFLERDIEKLATAAKLWLQNHSLYLMDFSKQKRADLVYEMASVIFQQSFVKDAKAIAQEELDFLEISQETLLDLTGPTFSVAA